MNRMTDRDNWDDDEKCDDPDCEFCTEDDEESEEDEDELIFEEGDTLPRLVPPPGRGLRSEHRYVVSHDLREFGPDVAESGPLCASWAKYRGGKVFERETNGWMGVEPFVGIVIAHVHNHVVIDFGLLAGRHTYIGWVPVEDIEPVNFILPDQQEWV